MLPDDGLGCSEEDFRESVGALGEFWGALYIQKRPINRPRGRYVSKEAICGWQGLRFLIVVEDITHRLRVRCGKEFSNGENRASDIS